MRWGWGCSGELQKPPSTALGADSDSSNILSIMLELRRGPARFPARASPEPRAPPLISLSSIIKTLANC